MSRITLSEFVSELLREMPELPSSVHEELAKAAVEPAPRRPALLRTVLERASQQTPAPQAGRQQDG